MRTNPELIRELEEEAANFDLVALAVGLDELTEFVFNNDEEKTEKLAGISMQGGLPIGLNGTKTEGCTLRVRYHVFNEFKDDPWAEEYLNSLTELFLQACKALWLGVSQNRWTFACSSSPLPSNRASLRSFISDCVEQGSITDPQKPEPSAFGSLFCNACGRKAEMGRDQLNAIVL
jgi:hypothetical protein